MGPPFEASTLGGVLVLSNPSGCPQEALLMDDRVYFLYQKLSAYICETLDTNEHVLVICNSYSGYIWAAKSGDRAFRMASKMI